MTIETEFVYIKDFKQQAKRKDWLAGTKRAVETCEVLIQDGQLCTKRMIMSNIILKIISEAIENVIDHAKRCQAKEYDPVTLLEVSYENRQFSILNNGAGIPTGFHKEANMYLVQLIFGEFGQGGNNKDTKDFEDDLGTNGLGIKIANIFSKKFRVITDDGQYKYTQIWYDGCTKVEPPIIESSGGYQFTCITFELDFEGEFADSIPYEDDIPKWIYTRLCFASAYLKYRVQTPVSVIFNGCGINYGMKDIAKLCGTPLDISLQSNIREGLTWEVYIVSTNDPLIQNITIVNGGLVFNGKHVEKIRRLIKATIKGQIDALQKKHNITIKTDFLLSNLVIFANCHVRNCNWSAQRKDTLGNNISDFKHLVLKDDVIKPLNKFLNNNIMSTIFNEKKKKEIREHDNYIDLSKYETALKKASEPLRCRLILTEGDSAADPIKVGLRSDPNIDQDYYGVMTLRGVIINAKKEISFHSYGMEKSKKLVENIFFNTFLHVTGLNIDYKYDKSSPTYELEKSKLKYGGIIACVDQDLDGFNIFGLIMNLFDTFWPNLLKVGYVYKFNTPIIRAYPTSKSGIKQIEEFYDLESYSKWKEGAKLDKYDIRYYKGLASHNIKEYKNMFKNFAKNLYVYIQGSTFETLASKVNLSSANVFEVYYGKNTNNRKVVLREPYFPVTQERIAEQYETKIVYAEEELVTNVHQMQRDNIERKINGMDGLNQSRRKILNAILKKFSGQNKNLRIRVDQFGGFVAEHENYHHGTNSIWDTITRMGFVSVNGNQIPLLKPEGSFGTRLCGGDNSGEARYTQIQANIKIIKLLYPKEDYYLLDFIFEEGKRGEPKYFMPIIPPIFECAKLPGTGWKFEIWARDSHDLIEQTKKMINGEEASEPKIWLDRFTGEHIYTEVSENNFTRKVELLIGKFEYDEKRNAVIITDLPPRTWTNNYTAYLDSRIYDMEDKKKKPKDDPYIKSYVTKSTDVSVYIVINLKPGSIECIRGSEQKVPNLDPIAKEFKIYTYVTHAINFIDEKGEIITFKCYLEVMKYWFGIRKKFYQLRIEHKILLLKLKIKYYENLIRFLCDKETNLNDLEEDDMIKLLQERKYDGITPSVVIKPEFRTNEKIESDFWSGKFDYILDVTERMKSSSKVKKTQKIKDDLVTELKDILDTKEEFVGQKAWLKEIDELDIAINVGKSENWEFNINAEFK